MHGQPTIKIRKSVYTYIMYGYEIITEKLGSYFHAVYPMLRVAIPISFSFK